MTEYDDIVSKDKDFINKLVSDVVARNDGKFMYLDGKCHRTTNACQDRKISSERLIICEHNPETYESLKNDLSSDGIGIYNIDIFKYIEAINPQNLYLDLMTSSVKDDELNILKKWLSQQNDSAHLFITLSARGQSEFGSRYDKVVDLCRQVGYKPKYVYGYYKTSTMLFMYICAHTDEPLFRLHKILETSGDVCIVKPFALKKNISIDFDKLESYPQEYLHPMIQKEIQEIKRQSIFDRLRFKVLPMDETGELTRKIINTIEEYGGYHSANISKSETNYIVANPDNFQCSKTCWHQYENAHDGYCTWITPGFIDACIQDNKLICGEELDLYIIKNPKELYDKQKLFKRKPETTSSKIETRSRKKRKTNKNRKPMLLLYDEDTSYNRYIISEECNLQDLFEYVDDKFDGIDYSSIQLSAAFITID